MRLALILSKSTTSGNGEALNRLASISQKVLGLTGTPFNGKASSTFNIEYALNPRTRERYPWGGATRLLPKEPGSQDNTDYHRTIDPTSDPSNLQGRSESRWVKDMGVRERVEEERPNYDADTGAYTGTSTYQRPYTEGAGCSPLLIAWMLDHTIFFSLADIGVEDGLPEYREQAIGVDLPEAEQAVYDTTMNFLKDYMRERLLQHSDNTFRGAYLAWAMGWVNALFRKYKIIHKRPDEQTGKKEKKVIKTIEARDANRIFPKEQKLVDIVRDELADDRPVLIFCRQTNKRDIQPRLEGILEEQVPQATPYILRSSSDTKKREALINRKVEAGTNVIICHPALVRTGLDLLDFVTIVFYEPIYDLYTMLQAAARSYRMNQPNNLVKVMYLYHHDTMEQQAIQLMSRKQRSAKIVTGDIGLSGLDELTSDEGSFEKELMDTLASTQSINDPQALFTQKEDDDYTRIDAAFWNVGSDDPMPDPEPVTNEPDNQDFALFAYNREDRHTDRPENATDTADTSEAVSETRSDTPNTGLQMKGAVDRLQLNSERIHNLLADIHTAATAEPPQDVVQALDRLLATVDRQNLPTGRIPAFGQPKRRSTRRRRRSSVSLADAPETGAADEDETASTRRVIDLSDRDDNRARTAEGDPAQLAMF